MTALVHEAKAIEDRFGFGCLLDLDHPAAAEMQGRAFF
jgi:hypothetical protein